jgi:hypothetical protein
MKRRKENPKKYIYSTLIDTFMLGYNIQLITLQRLKNKRLKKRGNLRKNKSTFKIH